MSPSGTSTGSSSAFSTASTGPILHVIIALADRFRSALLSSTLARIFVSRPSNLAAPGWPIPKIWAASSRASSSEPFTDRGAARATLGKLRQRSDGTPPARKARMSFSSIASAIARRRGCGASESRSPVACRPYRQIGCVEGRRASSSSASFGSSSCRTRAGSGVAEAFRFSCRCSYLVVVMQSA